MFIKKLKGGICLCINYCFLNTITKKDCYLILLIRGGLCWQTLPSTQARGRQISVIVEAYRLVLISVAGGSIP
jgi:hypothetical protein